MHYLSHPFNAGRLPLDYSGHPGVNASYREGGVPGLSAGVSVGSVLALWLDVSAVGVVMCVGVAGGGGVLLLVRTWIKCDSLTGRVFTMYA